MNYFSEIAKKCPVTVSRFSSDLMFRYGLTLPEFKDSGLYLQYRSVKRYFGYSLNVEINLSDDVVVNEIKAIFDEYENILLKYQPEFTVPDPLKRIMNMSNAEKTAYIEENFKREVRVCLYHALGSISHFKRPSLSDALVTRSRTIIEAIAAERAESIKSEELFWEEARRTYDKNAVAPF